MPTPRPIARTIWLALPATVALRGPRALGHLALVPALVAWLVVLALSGGLAWVRERRLRATHRYLAALAEGRAAGSRCPISGRSAATSSPTALHRLDRALAERRARQQETDQLVSTLLDALPDPVLLVGRRARRGQRQPGGDRAVRRRSERPAARGPAARSRACSRPSIRRRRATATPSSRCSCRARRGAPSASRSCRCGCAASRPR